MVPLVVRLCKETESAVRGINFDAKCEKRSNKVHNAAARTDEELFFFKASIRTDNFCNIEMRYISNDCTDFQKSGMN